MKGTPCQDTDLTVHRPNTFDFSIFTPNGKLRLPEGWTVGRKRSTVQLETNIRTLGQLYRTLSDLRNQLPSPVATAVENSSRLLERPTIDTRRRTSSSVLSMDDQLSPLSACGLQNAGILDPKMVLRNYPEFLFEPLVSLFLGCLSYPRIDKPHFMDTFRKGDKL
ncbi:hypothetical protein EC973_005206 [Apophysomyces ossiformis]|uniref:Uncharacterized protein n=1 Tax=Apophysomyces ossiformis TaxID=679940 RepID=A0A8H7BZB0_9FUNG|nr:hypothetical protein EC973_005206 [Apophysomyces ossiformis]